MKRLLLAVSASIAAMVLLNGCIIFSLGGGSKTENTKATVGQQLIDLQKARDTGAINEQDYQAQRAKILNSK